MGAYRWGAWGILNKKAVNEETLVRLFLLSKRSKQFIVADFK